jgi:hypothetical protein
MKRITFLALLMASTVTAQAQDPQEGAKWATNVCAQCHAVQPGQPPSPNGRAPTFGELANTSGMTSSGADGCAYHPSCRNADVRLNLRTAARHYRVLSELES